MDSIIQVAPFENGRHNVETTSGCYPEIPEGYARMTEEQLFIARQYNGFVFVEELTDGTLTIAPNTAAWEAWKAAEAAKPKPEPEPTTEEKLAALEQENKQLKEDAKLLRAQVDAQTEQIEFYDDCIAEMAAVVYA